MFIIERPVGWPGQLLVLVLPAELVLVPQAFFPPGVSVLYCDFLFWVLMRGGKRAGRRDSSVPENILIRKKMLNIALDINLSVYQP